MTDDGTDSVTWLMVTTLITEAGDKTADFVLEVIGCYH